MLPGVISLSDSDFFNEVLQEIALGSSLSFQLNLTSNLEVGAAVPDSFSFFILDSAASGSAVTTTLLGDALFAILEQTQPEGSDHATYADPVPTEPPIIPAVLPESPIMP